MLTCFSRGLLLVDVYNGVWRYLDERRQVTVHVFCALFKRKYTYMKHIGKLIREELERQDRTPTWLARKIACDRTNVYYIFKQESLHTDMIERLSVALNHNFFQDLADGIASQLS